MLVKLRLRRFKHGEVLGVLNVIRVVTAELVALASTSHRRAREVSRGAGLEPSSSGSGNPRPTLSQ
jgi:hypothetical protein